MSFFSRDGIFYRVSTVIYNLLILNILWILFSIPLLTIGASTTALFYVVGKIIRQENINSIFQSFWKSYISNFKQATVIWFIMLIVLFVLYINIINISLFGKMASFIYLIQIFALVELLIIYIFIFPLVSRYHITTLNAFKGALFIGNRYLLTTILSLAVIPGLYILLTIHEFFILGIIGIYGFWVSYLVEGKIEEYVNSI